MSASPRRNVCVYVRCLPLLFAGICFSLLAGCGSSPEPVDSPLATEPVDGVAHPPASEVVAGPAPKVDVEHLILTGGAAPGYVDDTVCSVCHSELYDSFRQVAKARSFYRPSADNVIEDFENNRFFHAPSQRYYEMSQRGDNYLFKRYELDAQGKPINVFQRKVDWILGSGNHARVYLIHSEGGELHQLPIAWYTQDGSWAMAPGFDRPDHPGLAHRIDRECMFCHNAYPDAPAGSDTYGMPDLFPANLPPGIGCQRCHGPGGEHVKMASVDNPDEDLVRASIVNPQQREDVCHTCHFQPSFLLSGVRRFGHADYSYVPGESQDDYLVAVDVSQEQRDRSQRFEINHHAYRLQQSACFQQSDGGLGCLTCHDPHHVVPKAERAEHYRKACLRCHQAADCRVDDATAEHLSVARDNCVDCHMPARRTQDVVHVAMTDHFIRRQPGGSELLLPLEESRAAVTDAELVDPADVPDGRVADVYRMVAILRASNFTNESALDGLQQLLSDRGVQELDPYLDLAEGQLKQRRFAEAEATLKSILARSPDHPRARGWMGIALASQKKTGEAIELIAAALKLAPLDADLHYNLGLLRLSRDEYEKAAESLQQAVSCRSNMGMGWFYLGKVYAGLGRLDEATDSYRRALEVDPTLKRAYAGIRDTLQANGQQAEAIRYWQHAARAAGAGSPGTGVPPQFRDRVELLPVLAPRLDSLDPADAEQFQALQQFFAGLIGGGKAAPASQLAAFGSLGQLYHAYQLGAAAEACYINASRLAPRDFRWPYLLGVVYQQEGKLSAAASQLEAARALQGAYEPMLVRLGDIYLQQNRLDEAQELFQAALKTNADALAAVRGLGEVALARGEHATAINLFQKALEGAPAANRVHGRLAAAYRGLGDLDQANEQDQQAGDVEIPFPDTLVDNLRKRFLGDGLYLVRGYIAFNAGRFEDAVDAFAEAVEARPDSVRARVNLAASVAKIGDANAAIAHFRKALEIDPEMTSAHLSLGMLLAEQGQHESAVEHFRFIAKVRPEDAVAQRNLARTLLQAGREEEALHAYRKLVELAPDDEEGSLELAALLIKYEQYAAAVAALTRAHEQCPNSRETSHALARLLASCPDTELRDGELAVELATKVHNVTQRHEHAETLAMALAQTGRFDEAIAIQEKLIAEAKRIGNAAIEQRLTGALQRYQQNLPYTSEGTTPEPDQSTAPAELPASPDAPESPTEAEADSQPEESN